MPFLGEDDKRGIDLLEKWRTTGIHGTTQNQGAQNKVTSRIPSTLLSRRYILAMQ